jgi:putative FmdB family regulatory protein
LIVPIYEYRCAVCGHQLEALQKMSDEPLSDCPACHAPELKKQISAVSFRLSGSGWYETDFKTKDQRNISGDKQPTNSTTEAATSSTSSTSLTSASQSSGTASQVSTNSDST